MSLRLRMLLVVVLALVALLVAGLALAAIVRDSRAATIATVGTDTEAAAVALARTWDAAPIAAAGSNSEKRGVIRAHAAAVLEPLPATRGGYCFRDGDFIEAESGSFRHGPGGPHGPRGPKPRGDGPMGGDDPPSGDGPMRGDDPPHGDGPMRGDDPPHGDGPMRGDDPPRGDGPLRGDDPPRGDGPPRRKPRGEDDGPPGPPGPPPDVRAALVLACQRAVVARVEPQNIENRGDTTMLFVVGVNESTAAFAMRIVPGARGQKGLLWWVVLVGMPIVTLVMVAVMIETMFALRRGVGDLGGTLVRLEHDLRGEVARPRAKELGQIADQLRAMAGRLADARDRERSLERKVSHQTRLGSLGRLVAGVAHEIRNPLTGIKLLLDGMRRRELDARTQRDVHTCLREIARLDEIVATFLGVAREAQAEPVTFEVEALVDERISAMGAQAEGRGVRVVRRGSATAFAERNVVLQIVDNLLRNAVEASPPGAEVEVEVTGSPADACIDVVDRGEGVPEGLVENLFEPFMTSKPGGTGLGLWLSFTAATSRGADLGYHREADRTHFTLTLPGPSR